MIFEAYYFNCSRQYIDLIHSGLFEEIEKTIAKLPKRDTQAELNRDLFWLLTERNWSYDNLPVGIEKFPPSDLDLLEINLNSLKAQNKRDLCTTSFTLDARWHADFAKQYGGKLIQLEAQFGKVESMFKDFCGFRIAYYERRLSLGIEIVMYEPSKYFIKHKSSITGMAYFEIAKKTLPAIGLDCPIFLIGIKDT